MEIAKKNSDCFTDPLNTTTLSAIWTVPNMLSVMRLMLAIVLFFLIQLGLFSVAAVLFLVAASTDWIDGWWARYFKQVSRLGRILDPLIDKVIVCGCFILLAGDEDPSSIAPWMAVVVVLRELIVTAVRAEMERCGSDFSAGFSGKLKMLLQCAAIGIVLAARAQPDWVLAGIGVEQAAQVTTWAAVAATIYSGVEYLFRARILLLTQKVCDKKLPVDHASEVDA